MESLKDFLIPFDALMAAIFVLTGYGFGGPTDAQPDTLPVLTVKARPNSGSMIPDGCAPTSAGAWCCGRCALSWAAR